MLSVDMKLVDHRTKFGRVTAVCWPHTWGDRVFQSPAGQSKVLVFVIISSINTKIPQTLGLLFLSFHPIHLLRSYCAVHCHSSSTNFCTSLLFLFCFRQWNVFVLHHIYTLNAFSFPTSCFPMAHVSKPCGKILGINASVICFS